MQPTFANLFHVYTGPQVVRMVFSDQLEPGGPAQPAANVAMSRSDAEALRDVLNRLLPVEGGQ